MHKGSCLERKCDDGVEDRRGDANGERWTDFSVWDICVVIRGDRKSGWWMGRPVRPTGKKKRDDKGWTQTRDRGGRGASNVCESRRGSELFERGDQSGEEEKVNPLRRVVITEARHWRWCSELAWPTGGGRVWREGTGEERGGFKVWGRRRKERRQPFETPLTSETEEHMEWWRLSKNAKKGQGVIVQPKIWARNSARGRTLSGVHAKFDMKNGFSFSSLHITYSHHWAKSTKNDLLRKWWISSSFAF